MCSDSTICREEAGWSQDLTLSKLNSMMTTFKGKEWRKPEIFEVLKRGLILRRTYIFAPQCPNLYTQGHVFVSYGGNHAEDIMVAQCGLPTEFYLTGAPCPDCAMMLYNEYNNKPKPTIHIALPYRGKGKTGSGNKNLILECLAMLVDAGFTIVPWDWRDFAKRYITNGECRAAVNEMIHHEKALYDIRYDEIEKDVNTINHEMHGANNYQICSDALKKKKNVIPKRKRKIVEQDKKLLVSS